MTKYFLLTIFALHLSGCQPESVIQEDPPAPAVQPLDPTLFAPKVGHIWIYTQISRQARKDAQLPIQKKDLKTARIKRTQRYEGPHKIDGETFHLFSIKHDETPQPSLLLDYRRNTLSVATQAQPDGSFIIDQSRIPIAQKEMAVGTFWRWPPSASGTSGFRIVSFEEARVPAGNFDAYKITYQGQQNGITSLKDYWFTPGIGIIKEESRTYHANILRALSTIELEEIIPPGSKKNPLDS